MGCTLDMGHKLAYTGESEAKDELAGASTGAGAIMSLGSTIRALTATMASKKIKTMSSGAI